MGCQAEKRRGDGGGSPRGIRPMLGTGEGPGVARENEPPGPTSAWHGMAGPGRQFVRVDVAAEHWRLQMGPGQGHGGSSSAIATCSWLAPGI